MSQESAELGFDELCKALSPNMLAQCNMVADAFIAEYSKFGDTGKVIMLYTSIKIAALAETGEI